MPPLKNSWLLDAVCPKWSQCSLPLPCSVGGSSSSGFLSPSPQSPKLLFGPPMMSSTWILTIIFLHLDRLHELLKTLTFERRVRIPWLRVLAVLLEDLRLVSGTYTRWLITADFCSSRRSKASGPFGHLPCACNHTQTHTYTCN